GRRDSRPGQCRGPQVCPSGPGLFSFGGRSRKNRSSTPLANQYEFPAGRVEHVVSLRQRAGRQRRLALEQHFQSWIAKPELRDKLHGPTVERVIEKGDRAMRRDFRVERVELLDEAPGGTAELHHGGLDV